MAEKIAIVKVGTWLYGGIVETPVDIISLDCDFDHELNKADGQLAPDDEPTPLGPDGCLYYVRFQHALTLPTPTWPDSRGFATVEEAMRCAEGKVKGGVRWHDRVGA
jgi:hypothetical protein